jgi:hypothetical protein
LALNCQYDIMFIIKIAFDDGNILLGGNRDIITFIIGESNFNILPFYLKLAFHE